MQLEEFLAGLRILPDLEIEDLERSGAILHRDQDAFQAFKTDPLFTLMRSPPALAEAIWRAVEARRAPANEWRLRPTSSLEIPGAAILHLMERGYTTIGALDRLSDRELMIVPRVAAATLSKIREQIEKIKHPLMVRKEDGTIRKATDDEEHRQV